jgi:hypothetical protein
MVILIADHPVVVAAKLRIRLQKTVAMFSLETFCSPRFPRLAYWMIQPGFTDYSVNPVMVYVGAFAVEATSDLFGTPIIPLPQLDYLLFERIVRSKAVRATSGLFFKALPPLGLVAPPPAVKHLPVNLRLSADSNDWFSFQPLFD